MGHRLRGQVEWECGFMQTAIPCPQAGSVKGTGGEQVYVDITGAAPHELMPLNEIQGFPIRHRGKLGQGGQQTKDFLALAQIATCQFADDPGMAAHGARLQQGDKRAAASPEVIYPA